MKRSGSGSLIIGVARAVLVGDGAGQTPLADMIGVTTPGGRPELGSFIKER